MNYRVALLGLVLVFGCKTYQEEGMKPVPASAAVSPNAAIKAWLEYKNTPKLTPAQIAKVKEAWAQYCAAVAGEQSAKTNSKTINRNISLTAITGAKVVQAVMQSLPPEKAMELQSGPVPVPVSKTNAPVRVRKVVK